MLGPHNWGGVRVRKIEGLLGESWKGKEVGANQKTQSGQGDKGDYPSDKAGGL